MSSYPANHPLWNILRLVITGLLLMGFLKYNYNQVDIRDAGTLIGVLAGLAGYDKLMPKSNEGGS